MQFLILEILNIIFTDSIDGIRFDITDMFQAKIRKDSIRTEYLNKTTSE